MALWLPAPTCTRNSPVPRAARAGLYQKRPAASRSNHDRQRSARRRVRKIRHTSTYRALGGQTIKFSEILEIARESAPRDRTEKGVSILRQCGALKTP